MAKKTFDLAALVNPLEGVSDLDTQSITAVPIAEIRTNSRNFYTVDDVDDLRESIELNGLLQPLVVIASSDAPGYKLISGHRRFKAIRRLYETDNERWATVPCIVLPDPQSPEREELMLIQANSTGRILSGWEMQQQARKIRDILVKLREQGVELPGRMRDIVAEQMKISASKLARLEAIDNNLTAPGWVALYKAGKLNESAAYALSQLSQKTQQDVYDYAVTKISPVAGVIASWVPKAVYVVGKKCPDGGGCLVAEEMYDRHMQHGELTGCAGCCKICLSRGTCQDAELCASCDNLPAPAAEPRKETCGQRIGRRLAVCREELGLDRGEMADRLGAYRGTYSAWENGDAMAVDRLAAAADTLGVSVDWLLGRTADRNTPQDALHWRPMSEQPAEGEWGIVLLRWGSGDARGMTPKLAQQKGSVWIDSVYGIEVSGRAVGWIPAPAPEDAADG